MGIFAHTVRFDFANFYSVIWGRWFVRSEWFFVTVQNQKRAPAKKIIKMAWQQGNVFHFAGQPLKAAAILYNLRSGLFSRPMDASLPATPPPTAVHRLFFTETCRSH